MNRKAEMRRTTVLIADDHTIAISTPEQRGVLGAGRGQSGMAVASAHSHDV